MARISEIRLTGKGKTDASIRFKPGTNVVSGDSDTGKSYLLRCVDYVFGAEEMTKVIDEAAGYELVWLELSNAKQETLTLARHLTGGDVHAYDVSIEDVLANQEDDITGADTGSDGAADISNLNVDVLTWKRQGVSKARDITSRVFPFFGLP